jgi:hypothetical protein
MYISLTLNPWMASLELVYPPSPYTDLNNTPLPQAHALPLVVIPSTLVSSTLVVTLWVRETTGRTIPSSIRQVSRWQLPAKLVCHFYSCGSQCLVQVQKFVSVITFHYWRFVIITWCWVVFCELSLNHSGSLDSLVLPCTALWVKSFVKPTTHWFPKWFTACIIQQNNTVWFHDGQLGRYCNLERSTKEFNKDDLNYCNNGRASLVIYIWN